MKKLKFINKVTQYENLRDFFKGVASEYAELDAFKLKIKNKKETTYKIISYAQTWEDINKIGTALMHRGLKNKRVAIVGKNSYQWFLAYAATLVNGNIAVPIDKELQLDELESCLERSKADIVFFDDGREEMIKTIKEKGSTNLTQFYCMDEVEGYETTDHLLLEGEKLLVDNTDNDSTDKFATAPIDKHAMAVILFTSGTTSQSKAVMLSQHNLMINTYETTSCEPLFPGEINMAFLPYHHTFGSTGQLVMMQAGVCTAYCDGIKYLQKNLVEYKVSVFFCVPALIEGIYKKIMKEVEAQGKIGLIKFGIGLTQFLLKFKIDVRRKFFKSILDKLGGNIRFLISGAAPIDPDALKAFNAFGILTVQGYGITETSPVVSAESITAMKKGSVGLPLPSVEVKIDSPNESGEGEVLVKGENVMLGYYENEEATNEVLQDGWYRTGDLGRIDSEGYLFLNGRAKNVIVLTNGKNVYPEELEILINNLQYVTESMVFAAEKKSQGLAVSVKIVYDKHYFTGPNPIITDEEIEVLIKDDIYAINETLPIYKQIKRIITTTEPMIKTTTGKIKRHEEMKLMQEI